MIDLLQKIIDKEIAEDEAQEIADRVVDDYHEGKLSIEPRLELNMDDYEWTAYAHGASLARIAQWRNQGWPIACDKCGARIDYRNDAWIIRNDKIIGLSCCD